MSYERNRMAQRNPSRANLERDKGENHGMRGMQERDKATRGGGFGREKIWEERARDREGKRESMGDQERGRAREIESGRGKQDKRTCLLSASSIHFKYIYIYFFLRGEANLHVHRFAPPTNSAPPCCPFMHSCTPLWAVCQRMGLALVWGLLGLGITFFPWDKFHP